MLFLNYCALLFSVQIPLKNIFNSGDDGIGKFKFVENCQLNDFVFLPNNLLRGSRQADVSHCMLLGGFSPSISLHHIGGKLQFQTFSRLAREKVGTAISKTLSSFFGNNISNPSPPPDKSRMADVVEEINLVSSFDFEDPKRRIIRMSIDPRGKLVAAADSLGRVTLFDTRTQGIVRYVFKFCLRNIFIHRPRAVLGFGKEFAMRAWLGVKVGIQILGLELPLAAHILLVGA